MESNMRHWLLPGMVIHNDLEIEHILINPFGDKIVIFRQK